METFSVHYLKKKKNLQKIMHFSMYRCDPQWGGGGIFCTKLVEPDFVYLFEEQRFPCINNFLTHFAKR